MEAASREYSAGFPKEALARTIEALACSPNVQLYRLAAMYACAAHDQKRAQLYVARVPVQFQGHIVQRCQQEGIDLQP
jgi:hypothetical protein